MTDSPIARWLDGPEDAVLCRASGGAVVTRAAFRDTVAAAAVPLAELPAGTRLATDASDPLRFAVHLAAILWRGHTPVLFPGRGAQFTQLQSEYDAVLTDDPAATFPKPAVVVSTPSAGRTVTLTAPEAGREVRLFTSGSSGTPKCTAKTVGLLAAEATVTTGLFAEDLKGSVLIGTVDPRHLYGLTFNIWLPLTAGLPFAARRAVWQEDIVLEGEQLSLITTPTFLRLMDTAQPAPALQFVLTAGGPLDHESPASVHAWTGADIREIYGSTETGVIAARRHFNGVMTDTWSLIPEASLTEEEGRWLLHSPLTVTGTYPLDDRLEKTGLSDFRLLGRRDRIVKIGEERISLTEIERTVEERLGLTVRALPVTRQGRTVIAAVIAQDASTSGPVAVPTRTAVHAALAGRLDPLAVPKYWRLVPSFPVNAQGKIETQTLTELFHV